MYVIRILIGSIYLLTGLGCRDYPRQTSTVQEQADAYLKENIHILKHYDKGYGMDSNLLDTVVDDYEIFLTGEAHGIALNHDLCFDFLVYFYDKADVRYLLISNSGPTEPFGGW